MNMFKYFEFWMLSAIERNVSLKHSGNKDAKPKEMFRILFLFQLIGLKSYSGHFII